jgi:hypothetical protein
MLESRAIWALGGSLYGVWAWHGGNPHQGANNKNPALAMQEAILRAMGRWTE